MIDGPAVNVAIPFSKGRVKKPLKELVKLHEDLLEGA